MSAPRTHAPTHSSTPSGAVPSPFANLGAGLDRTVARGIAKVTGSAIGPYQSAIVRIGFGLTWLLFLLREWPNRSALYGPDSAWGFDLAKRLIAGNHAFSVLMWNDGRAWFEIVYAVAILASAALLLGWRTRTSALMFMVGVLSLQNRSVYMGDGGDNVVHIMAIYLAFTRCGQVWSLDSLLARRAAARASASASAVTVQAAAGAEATAGAVEPEGAEDAKGVGSPERAGSAAGEAEPARPGSAGNAVPIAATRIAANRAPGSADPVGVALWTVLGAALVIASLAGKLSTGWGLIFWGCWVGQAVWWAVRRYAPGEPRAVLRIISNIVHNGAMLVIVAEVCLIYSTAGWYKIQGSRWEDGTALYYPLHLDDFTPWPSLSHALAGNDLMVMLITYGTVIVQVAFPFTLFNRRVKNVLLVAMMVEHASIAIVLGLPFFSLAMIAADAVFLPTNFLLWAGDRLVRAARGRHERPVAAIPDQRAGDVAEPAIGPPPSSAVT